MLMVTNLKSEKRYKNEENSAGLEKLNTLRSDVQAITHVDFSARIQTVNKNSNEKIFKLE